MQASLSERLVCALCGVELGVVLLVHEAVSEGLFVRWL